LARSTYRRRQRRYYGRSRALEHIEDARRFSRETGGYDQDVKDYFFSLKSNQLRTILDAYERRHGREARNYAAQALPDWRSGKVKMSGMVDERLFNLLPPRMPLSDKYALTEKLWLHFGPSSKKTIRIGLDADVESVIQAVQSHIEEVVLSYKIPLSLEQRFHWLSSGDVNVKQQLLNHLRQMEKSLVVDGARLEVPALLDHVRADASQYTSRAVQVLRVGKHELELVIDRHASGVIVTEPSSFGRTGSALQALQVWWLWWVIGGAILIYLFSR
jgi:hypothetical protein